MLKNIIIACRSLTKRGRNNGIKILSLAVGLAMGLVLIAKVYYEQSYDTFYPDADRVFLLNERIVRDGELKDFPQVSGGVAVGMKNEVPGVETATRGSWLVYKEPLYTKDKKKYNIELIAADENFFDVLPRKMIVGNAKEVLSRPDYVLISKELADKIGGNVVGQIFTLDSYPGKTFTIGGVFETVPKNTYLYYDAITSIDILKRPKFDGTMNWIGNDRYFGFVKLQPGVTPESLTDAMHKMQENNQDLEALKKAGVGLSYTLSGLPTLHDGSPEVKRMMWLLALLAFALIFTAVMNYVLIVISSLVARTKEIAVHKSFGASRLNIHGIILSETLVHLVISIIVSTIMIFAFRGTVEELLDASLGALLNTKSLLILTGVCCVVFLVAGLLPGNLFARIPVAAAFRSYSENRRKWKLVLLFFQFMAVGFMISLLVVITRQYNHMVNDNPGYDYENLAYYEMKADSTQRASFINEVRALPEVEAVTTFSELPFNFPSGNNISLPNDDRELFNISDLYFVGNNYLSIMNVPVVMGRSFIENVSSSHEVMVNRSFVDRMAKFIDWPDGPIGKNIFISEHSQRENETFTICGVYEDFRIGSISYEDTRPSVMFYNTNSKGRRGNYLLIKFKHLTPEGMIHVQETLQRIVPDKEVIVYDWRSEMTNLYKDSRLFRDSVMIGCSITLLIALIGLIGYTRDEINRRRKEIAIRKINGATLKEVLKLFEIDILRMALPALIIGCGIAAYVASKWQEGFSEKVSLSWYWFVLCAIAVLAVILSVVAFNVRSAANENPVKSLKSE